MKKLMTFLALFLGIVIFSVAQTNIAFHIKSNKGKIFMEENTTYSLSFKITGIDSEADANELKNTFTSNAKVKSFTIIESPNNKGDKNARLIVTSKEKADIIALLKSGNVTKLFVDGKEYGVEEIDKISADLKAKNKAYKNSVSKTK
jgi:hypothetical protein